MASSITDEFLQTAKPDETGQLQSPTFNPWGDSLNLVSGKFNTGVAETGLNYHDAWLMTQTHLTDEQDLQILKDSQTDGFKNISTDLDNLHKSAPWGVQLTSDAAQMIPSLATNLGIGVATGGAAVAASNTLTTPLAAIPGVGPALSGAAKGLSFGGGFTAGSLASLGTQSGGSLYRILRMKGASRELSRNIAGAYGVFSAALGSVGLGATQKLGGAAATLGLRNSLVPLAEQAGVNTSTAFARQIQSKLLTRLGLAYAQHVTANTVTGEIQVLAKHASLGAAGYFAKHDFGAYTNWGDAKKDVEANFLQLLAANAIIGLGVGGAGYAKGKIKTTVDSVLTPEMVKQLETKLKNTDPNEILRRVNQAIKDTPGPNENPQEAQGQIVHQPNGDVVLMASTTKTAGEPAPAGDTQNDPNAQLDTLFGTETGVATAPDSTVVPHTGAEATPDAQGRVITATEDVNANLSPEETQARLNQIGTDTRLLDIERRRLEAEFSAKDKLGHSVRYTYAKWEKVLNLQDQLQTEKELLQSDLLGRQDISEAKGQARIKTLGRIMDRLQRSNEKLIEQKQKYNGKIQVARQTGANVERQHIQSMQKQLKQYINAATKDPKIRTQLAKKVNSVTTSEQFKKAGQEIQTRLVDLENKKVQAAEKATRGKLISNIEDLIQKGSTVKLQSGHPVSKFDADTVKKMQVLKAYLQDQNLPVKKQNNLTGQVIDTYHNTHLNPDDPTSPTYADLMASGQSHLIPVEDQQHYQLAVMAHKLKDRGVMELNIIKGNIGQMIEDSKNEIAQKQEVLAKQRAEENQIAEDSTGATTHSRIRGNPGQLTKTKQRTESVGSWVKMWDGLMEYVSYDDANHALKDLVDVTPAKRTYYTNKEIVKLAMKKNLQDALTQAGNKMPLQQYMNEATNDEYEFRYPEQSGDIATARHNRAQLMTIYGWLQDDTLHPTMRNAEQGNNWTLEGDAPQGESFQELVKSVLKPEDIAVVDAILGNYKDYGEGRVNEFYREKYGADLPIKDNYSPVSREVHRVDVGAKRQQMFASLLPGSSKTRVNSLKRLVPYNIFDGLDDHVDDWEHFIAYDGVFGTMQNVFKRNTKVRQAIIDQHGQGTMQVIDNFINRFVDDTPMPSNNQSWFWSAMQGSLARAVLPWRAPVQVLQQLTAGTAMWKEHSLPEIIRGYGKAAQNLIETEKAFRASPILRHRYEGGATYDLKMALSQAGVLETALAWATGLDTKITPEHHHALVRLAFEGIRGGDAATVRIFGAPIYWAEIEKGKTPEQAMMRVERLAETTQQGDSVDQIPDIFANNQVLYTLVGQFHLQPLQLYAHEMLALRDFAANPTPANSLRLAKQTAILWVLPGLFYGAVQNAPSLIAPPTDNPDTQKQAITAIASSGILGPVNGVPLAGDIIEAAWFAAMKPAIGVDMGYRSHLSGNSVVDRADNFFQMLASWEKVMNPKEDVNPLTASALAKDPSEDLFKAIFKTARALGPLTGTPSQYINAPAGIVHALQHDDILGAVFAATGWSPGSINPRYKEAKQGSLASMLKPHQTPLIDYESLFTQGVTDSTPDPTHEDNPYNVDWQDVFSKGAAEGSSNSEPPE